jgi:inositol transport system ATP-binding protein
MSDDYILEMNHITKTFSGVTVLDDVSLQVRRGIVLGLMGENGAGKSTLMKILQGIYTPTEGEVIFEGKKLKVNSIIETLIAGISMIHQEMSPIPDRTVAQNIFLGREPKTRLGFIDDAKLRAQTQLLLDDLGLNFGADTKMRDLTIANMQMVEIAKAISFGSKLIIMDEPTSAISEREVDNLFRIICKLKKKGTTIIYISHKMDEILKITDEIVVLRDGKKVGQDLSENLTQDALIRLMVGRSLDRLFPKEHAPIGDVILRVENLTRGKHFRNVSFEVRRGEILGFAGLVGAGRSEVLETVYGLRTADCGKIFVSGKECNIRHTRDAINVGIGLLTEDRKASGCFLSLTTRENIIMPTIGRYLKMGFIRYKVITQKAEQQRQELAIKATSLSQKIQYLSGGNQQKALVARWLINNPDILIVDEPTRGIDVNAKAEIHKKLCDLAKQGKAIIMVSSEMPEIMGMSDRIYVMHEGEITGELNRDEFSQERIALMASLSREQLEAKYQSS